MICFFISVPEPGSVLVGDIRRDKAVVSFQIPDSPVNVTLVEIELNETESGDVRTIIRPAQANGSITIDGLRSGNDYNVRVRSIAADGRSSDFTPSTAFTSGKFMKKIFAFFLRNHWYLVKFRAAKALLKSKNDDVDFS